MTTENWVAEPLTSGSMLLPNVWYQAAMVWTVPVQFNSVAQLCPTLWPPGLKHPGFPVHHQLPELAQTHVHRVGDVIQPSCPLLSPLLLPSIFSSIRVFSSESVLCIRVSASASVLPMNIQDWFPIGLMALISLLSRGLSRVFSNTTVQKHQFFDIHRASLVAQRVKHLPAVQEIQVLYLGQENTLEKAMAPHSSTLAWKVPWMEKPGRLQSMGS